MLSLIEMQVYIIGGDGTQKGVVADSHRAAFATTVTLPLNKHLHLFTMRCTRFLSDIITLDKNAPSTNQNAKCNKEKVFGIGGGYY